MHKQAVGQTQQTKEPGGLFQNQRRKDQAQLLLVGEINKERL